MLPKGIMFDLDDTILAYSPVAEPTWRKVCETYAEKEKGLSAEALLEAIFKCSKWFWNDPLRHKNGRLDLIKARREILAMAFDHLDISGPDLANQIADAFSTQREEAVYLFDGAIHTLRTLKNKGVTMALITNGATEKQRRKIERFDLAPFFQTILIEGEVGFGKPEQAVYSLALDAMDLSPKDVWFVGDNLEWDVAAPQRLGIFGIWNDYRQQGFPASAATIPDRIIHSISELCI